MTTASGRVMRSWTGWIRPEDRAVYQRYLEETGLREYRETPGNLGAFLIFRDLEDGRTELRTLSLWESREAIAAFAGDHIETAHFYDEDDKYLLDRELTAEHYDLAWADWS